MINAKRVFIAQCAFCVMAFSSFIIPWPWGFFAAVAAVFGSLLCIALSMRGFQ